MMQEVRSWVSSPLGHNLLLAMFKDATGPCHHFIQKCADLIDKTEFIVNTKGFTLANTEMTRVLKDINSLEQVESPRDAAIQWAKQYSDTFKSGMERNIPSSAQIVLLNSLSYQSPWAKDNGNSLMKVYNSFSYTQDVHYEARILELPLRDKDFKLVIIAPNDVDLLQTLFRRLTLNGLRAAICNIQPLFTTKSKLMAPVIQFESEEVFETNVGKIGDITVTQYGYTKISKKGAQFDVISYLYQRLHTRDKEKTEVPSPKEQPLCFGLVFQDTPIFTGQFSYDNSYDE